RPYSSETARREALAVWVNHYNYHRPHTSCGDAPPASLAPTRVNNVMPSYT
ncbi:integrase core domain-containing protein, partial [Micrococcus luteus]